MQEQKNSVTNRYISFMGSWMAGSVVGYYVGKLIVTGFVLWFIYKFLFN